MPLVVHLNLPVDLHQRAMAHQREVTRELVLVLAEPGRAPRRLIEVAAAMQPPFAPLAAAATADLEAAIERGADHVDLRYEVSSETVAVADQRLGLLDEVDAYSRSGQLLSLPASPDVVAYRRWFLGEFGTQARGSEPTPWPSAP